MRAPDGTTLVHVAAELGDAAMLDWLLEEEIDVFAKTDAGYSPLHTAAARGHVGAVEWLAARGADVNAGTSAPLPCTTSSPPPASPPPSFCPSFTPFFSSLHHTSKLGPREYGTTETSDILDLAF